MWRLCKLGYRHEPRLMLASFVLSQLAALPDALLALWLCCWARAISSTEPGLMQGAAWASGVGGRHLVSAHGEHPRAAPLSRQGDHRARVACRPPAGDRRDDRPPRAPRILDRLSMLRNQVFVLDHMYVSLFSTLGWILRLGVTMALLASIHPALLLLAVFAIPTVLTSTWRPEVERSAQERGAQAGCLARHLFTIATTAPPGKEVRVTGIGERLVTDRRAAWERWYGPVAAARGAPRSGMRWVGRFSAWLMWARWSLSPSYLRAPASAVLLVLAAGARLSGYIGATVGEIGFLRGFWMDGSRRLAWLEDYAASIAAAGDLAVPAVLHQGLRLDHVSFAYPGT